MKKARLMAVFLLCFSFLLSSCDLAELTATNSGDDSQISESGPSDSSVVSTPITESTETSEETEEPPISVDPSVTEDVKEKYTLSLTEAMAKSTMYMAEDGKPKAWIELYNNGSKDVELSELSFSTGNRPTEAALSGTIAAGQYKVIWLEEFSDAKSASVFHKSGVCIATVTLPEELKKDLSVALDGITSGGSVTAKGEYCVTNLCTPGFANDLAGRESYLGSELTGLLVINELMASNNAYLEQNGEFYDWLEIKNVSSTPVNLSDYYLSDRDIDPKRFALPAGTLGAGESIVIYCSGDKDLGANHAPFKISSDGERIYLTNKDGARSDSVMVYGIPLGGSMGRMDGKKGFFYFQTPTPQAQNNGGFRAVAQMPTPSVKAGAYGETNLTVELYGDGKIYYTTDGTKPTTSSSVYSSPFTLTKNTVIRAFSVSDGKAQSPITTAAYILGSKHTLPVVNIAADHEDIFSAEKGIYHTNNQWQKWEREINLSIFDKETGDISIDCGIRLSGDGSRALDKKSFQLRFRSRYGASTMDYDVFGDGKHCSFNAIKLRAGEDYPYSLFRDELITAMAGDNTTVNVQDYRFCALYINGEYFGIYCFRDKVDEDYVAYTEGVDADDVDLIGYAGGVEHGSGKDYRELITYVKSHDLSNSEYYEYVKTQVDLESLMDWMINQVYTANRDLPNDRCYKVKGGKWKWVLYDCDWGFYHHDESYYLVTSGKLEGTADIAEALLENDEFVDTFLKRMGDQLRNVYNFERFNEYCNMFTNLLKDEMPANCEKWGGSVSRWMGYITRMKNFVKVRNEEVVNETASFFRLTAEQKAFYFEGASTNS